MTLTRPHLRTLLLRSPSSRPCSRCCWSLNRSALGHHRRRRGRERSQRRPPARRPARGARRPGSAAAYAALGDTYLQRARETGDPSFYTRADRLLRGRAAARPARARRRARGRRRSPGSATTSASSCGSAREARALAAAAWPSPLTVIADAQVELGRYGAAAARRSSAWWTRSPGSPPTRASPTSASCTATRRARSRPCAWRVSAGGGAPENRAYVESAPRRPRASARASGRGARAFRDALRSMPGHPGPIGRTRAGRRRAGGTCAAP